MFLTIKNPFFFCPFVDFWNFPGKFRLFTLHLSVFLWICLFLEFSRKIQFTTLLQNYLFRYSESFQFKSFHFTGFQLFDWVSVCLHFLRRWLAASKVKTNLIHLIGRFKYSVFRLVLNFEFQLNFGANYWLEFLVQSNNDLFYSGWSIGLRELLNWKVSLTALLRICWQSEFTPNWAILSPPFCSVSPTFLSFQTANTTFCPPVTSTSFALKKPRPRLLTHAGFWTRWLTWRNLARLFTWLSIVSLLMSSTIV